MPAWLAGVVAGSCARHGTIRCVPDRSQRAIVGRSPDCTAHRASGSASPSIWMTTTPGTSVGDAFVARRAARSMSATNQSSSPASSSQPTMPISTAYNHDAQNAGQNPDKVIPGVASRAT